MNLEEAPYTNDRGRRPWGSRKALARLWWCRDTFWCNPAHTNAAPYLFSIERRRPAHQHWSTREPL